MVDRTFSDEDLRALLNRMVDSIQNFDDRNSPEDWPEAMLITADELGNVFWQAVEIYDEARSCVCVSYSE